MREDVIWFSNHTPAQNINDLLMALVGSTDSPAILREHASPLTPVQKCPNNNHKHLESTTLENISEEKDPVYEKYFTTTDHPGPSSPIEHQLITMFTGSQPLYALPTLLFDKRNKTFMVDDDSKYKRCTTTA